MNNNKHLFKLADRKFLVQNLKRDDNELTTEIVLNGALKNRSHTYKTNCLVLDCRYEVLLEMTWQVTFKLSVVYLERNLGLNSAKNFY